MLSLVKGQKIRRIGVQAAVGVALAIDFRQFEERRRCRGGQGHVHNLVFPVARPFRLVPGLEDLWLAAGDINRGNADGVYGVVERGVLRNEARDHLAQRL